MKIALLHYAAPPVVGGVESVLGEHARLMAEAGHQVAIIAGRGEQVLPGVNFHSLPLADSRHPEILKLKEKLDNGRIPDSFERLSAELLHALRMLTSDTDVLIAHNVCSLAKNLPLTAAIQRLSRVARSPRLILWHHDLAWTTPRYQAELHPGYPWDLLRSHWTGVTQVVVSQLRQAELADLMHIGSDQIQVIPNGVDLKRFHKLESLTTQLIDQIGLVQAAPILLLPVRITPRKNIELALHILAKLRTHFTKACLLISGPLGPHNPANQKYFERLLALREELDLGGAAHFLAELYSEYLPDEVIYDFYHLADALLFPSREEGFGIPVLEAGLAGLPVFCAAIQPLQELGGGWATYFSPDGKPGEIARRIAKRLAGSPTYQARQAVRQGFNWPQIYERHLAPLLAST